MPDAHPLKLWVVLARAYTALYERASADIARHDLTVAEFAVLEVLHHKGPLLLGEVQKKVLVSSGGVTYLVDRLEQRGLVRRKLCASDRRARYAELTDQGQTFMQRIFPEHVAAIRDALSALTDDEQEQAITLLKKLGHHAARV